MREAIQRLRHEGLIKAIPREGILVTAFSAAEIQQVYEMAAKLVAQRFSKSEVQKTRFLKARTDEPVEFCERHNSIMGGGETEEFRRQELDQILLL